MLLKKPSHILIMYEALWCIWDSKLELILNSEPGTISAKVISFDKKKEYLVSYCQLNQTIISNYNKTDSNDKIDYPSLSLLLFLDILDYQSEYWEILSNVILDFIELENTQIEFDFFQRKIDEKLKLQWMNIEWLHDYCSMLIKKIELLWIKTK